MSNDREKEPGKRHRRVTFTLNATALERWLLKTLINISFDGDYYIGADSKEIGRPSDTLVKIAFGQESFREENGMFVAYKKGGLIVSKDTVKFRPIIKDNKFIYGGKFSFRGVLLFLDISPDGIKIPFEEILGTDPDWHNVHLSRRFKQIKAELGGRISHVVNFKWL